jgi:hypothetical protein
MLSVHNEGLMGLRAMIMQLCHTVSKDLSQKAIPHVSVHHEEVVRQSEVHIEYGLHLT